MGLCICLGLVPCVEKKTPKTIPTFEFPSQFRFAPTGVGSDEEKAH